MGWCSKAGHWQNKGKIRAGVEQINEQLQSARATGTEFLQAYTFGLLAEQHGKQEDYAHGLALLDEALALVESSDERWCEAELYRRKGELLDRSGAPPEEVESALRRALAVARRQEAKLPELRSSLSLARLWQRQARTREAYELLATVYAWFSEGFDTPDLQAAYALLAQLK